MAKIVICSGGTGGHMFPACALFEKLKQRGHSVLMITDTRGSQFSQTIAEKIVVNTIRFNVQSLLPAIWESVKSIKRFATMWYRNKPDLIIGFGGLFTIIPIVIAKLFGTKAIIYEQNSIVGKANKLLATISDEKASTFFIDDSWHQIASPVRKEFIEQAKHKYKCNKEIKIVIIGGSQGALSFSNIIPKAFSLMDEKLRKEIEIVQQVSSAKLDDLRNEYNNLGIKAELVNFVYNMAEEMAEAQLVICRSGASTLSELSTLGRPAILIPYPLATDNHQLHNALYYQKKKAAWVIEEGDNIEKKLSEIIINLINNRELLKEAASNMINKNASKATDVFADFIEKSLAKKQ